MTDTLQQPTTANLDELAAVRAEMTEAERERWDYLMGWRPQCLTFNDLRIWNRQDPPVYSPFRLNSVQSMLLDTLCTQQGIPQSRPWELKGLRTSCLKARQQGMSTFWLALWYLMFYNLPYSQTVVLSHRAESTNRLWQTVELWESDLRKRFDWLPKLRYSNRKEITRADTGSSILIATAGMDDVATSGLITTVHRSETALWKAGAESQIIGILGALPSWGNLIEESTGRGFNEHKNRWDAQVEEPTAFFFPFTDSAEYAVDPLAGFVRTKDETPLRSVRILAGQRIEEPVTDAALQWRRLKHIEYTKEGKPEATAQEFPLSPEEAFFASAGNAYYPTSYLYALMEEMRDVEPVEVIEVGDRGFGGRVELFELPVDGVRYVIGADEAEGHAADDKHDDSAADGFREDTREQVLVYHGRPDGEHFAYDLDGLSGYYNTAMLVPERTPLGGTTCNKLLDIGANIYRHETGVEGAPERTKYGYPSNERAKALRDESLKAKLCQAALVWEKYRDDGMTPSAAAREVDCPVLKSNLSIKQLIHYANLKNRKRGGVGSHDDHNSSVTCATWYLENWTMPGETWKPDESAQDWRPAYEAQWSRR